MDFEGKDGLAMSGAVSFVLGLLGLGTGGVSFERLQQKMLNDVRRRRYWF